MNKKTEEELWADPRARRFELLTKAILINSDLYAPILKRFVQAHADFIEELMGPGFKVDRTVSE